jgi:hypothetical protein
MTDNELADRIVALGVGFKREFTKGPRYTLTKNRDYLDAPSWVRDWRVAGELLDKFEAADYQLDGLFELIVRDRSTDEPLRRAICEACVEALK